MPKKSLNNNLHKARENKNDEFYTQLRDIENELGFYKNHLKGKVVFCNCDDPEYSDFFKYFVLQFKSIGLKKLITTHFSQENQSYKLEVNSGNLQNFLPFIKNISIFDNGEIFKNFGIPLNGNGDFRSDESIEILKTADIVVTNPPFSLFREYVAQLFEYDKKFIIIGSMNAITYKETFKLIKENKIWLGNTFPKHFKEPNGNMKNFGNICWFTNLENKKRHEDLILYKKYDELEYQKYDNYEIINIDKVKDIPINYNGIMGVPITFLNNYNPEQFEVLGISNSARYIGHECYTLINGKKIYNRIIIKNKKI